MNDINLEFVKFPQPRRQSSLVLPLLALAPPRAILILHLL